MILTGAEVYALVRPYDWDHEKAVWIVYKESSNNPTAYNAAGPWYGLFQIADIHGYTVAQLYDSAFNVKAAYDLYKARGWQPWPVASSYPETMITDGWLDFATRKTGPPAKVNGGTNAVKGIFLHSAEGYEAGLWSQLANAPVSWHLTVMLDGRLFQHYPLTAQCWHATAANNAYIGIEHEGKVPQEPTLTDAQIKITQRVIAHVAVRWGWTPKRPTNAQDVSHTLWEHREAVRLGGTGSACPSGRIPWEKILGGGSDLANLSPDGKQRIVSEGNFIVIYNADVPVYRLGSTDGQFPGRKSKNFAGTWLWERALDDAGNIAASGLYLSEVEGD